METTVRDNEKWLTQLRSRGAEQQSALSDLRKALLRGLRGAMSSRAYVDESFLEDAVQDALVLILDRLHQFEGRSRFLTWATSIAIRVTMSKLRREHWKDVSLEEVIAESGFMPDDKDNPGPELQFSQNAVLHKMYSIIRNELTDKQKVALLAELKGIPMDEIARHLGSNRNAVYKLTHDARKRLKQGLESAGYAATDINAAFIA